ncbi:MAG TPA: F0F1 ATP synthase subunit B [Candidatus Dormibacteraeota bacterium]
MHFALPPLDAGLLDINGTLIAELIAFLLMLAVLSRWVYPWIIERAEERQRQIAQQLEAADRARKEADENLKKAQASVQEARVQAGQIIERANRAGERIQQEAQEQAREEAKRIVEAASRDIDTERQKAIQAIREQMADIVGGALAKIVADGLDGDRHKKLIEAAIDQVEQEPSASK